MDSKYKSRLIRVAETLQKLAGGFSLTISDKEMEALRFLSKRYDSAAELYNGLVPVNEAKNEYNLPEHVLWEAYEATKTDGGNEGVVPNLGGALGKKIHQLFDSMV